MSFLRFALCALLLGVSAPSFAQQSPASSPRATLVTAWDDFYVYVGAQVSDAHVNSTNGTPTSQPQQDDDIEVFFDTGRGRSKLRTSRTFQMAVSAGNGAYFSVGNGGPVPAAKAVYTYKYAAQTDGTLNSNRDRDTGYTVELAIPWSELGEKGPPKAGSVWGFNVLSRDRDTTANPASRFYSLSPNVTSAADVQNPSKWTAIVFANAGGASTPERVLCPHVTLGRYPLINGSIVSGEWDEAAQLAFGGAAVDAPAPTLAEEPNTTDSPFAALPPPDAAPPAPNSGGAGQETPAPAPPDSTGTIAQLPQAPSPFPDIDLPGGGSIKVVPGGVRPPPLVPGIGSGTTVAELPKPKKGKKKKGQKTAALPPDNGGFGTPLPGQPVNPLSAAPQKGVKPITPANVSLTGSLRLGPDVPPALVMAVYRVDFNADPRKGVSQNVWDRNGATLLADQPMDGAGPWFSCLRPAWHRQQLADMRRAGVDVALVRARANDPLLSRELDALVQALKEMKNAGQDYPLIDLDIRFSIPGIMQSYFIPAEFQANIPDGALNNATVITPGRQDTAIVSRANGQKYESAWEAAINSKARYVIIDSWNDYAHGTEVAATRQYGEKYADDTRIATVGFHGGHEWHALYLANSVPHTLKPRSLYQVTVRVLNGGTLPWRAGEGYSLCPRWYKNGRLFDDSAPRIPIGADVFPGQTVTLSVGVAAQNGYGDDLAPGDYTLALDMVQGQDRWFSYAGDAPLQVPVTLVPAAQTVPRTATFLGTDTSTVMQAGQTYTALVSIRNDGGQTWTAEKLAYKVQAQTTLTDSDGSGSHTRTAWQTVAQGTAAFSGPIVTGQVANVAVPIVAPHGLRVAIGTDKPTLLPTEYRLHWFIQSDNDVDGTYDESLRVVDTDPGVSFALSDVPRTVEAGKDATGRLAIGNLGPAAWKRGSHKVGYHWYFLDGTLLQWDGGKLTNFSKDVPPGRADGDITAKFHAPETPGRYALVWDVQDDRGVWASTIAAKGDDVLAMLVTVTKGNVSPVDLKEYASAVGIAGGAVAGDGFDGAGHALPAEFLPPDGTAERDANPLLIGPPGAPLYPSGYYSASVGEGANSNRRVSFLYPQTNGTPNVVSCKGQTISVPGGKTLHLLMAAGSDAPVTADFNAGNGPRTVIVGSWTQDPTGPNVTLGLRVPFRNGKNGPELVPCFLGDYSLPLSGKTLVLPNAPNVKIVAISVEK